MGKPSYGVIYDADKLYVRRVISPDHDRPDTLFDGTFLLGPGEAMAIVSKDEVRGMALFDLASIAIERATGRKPPSMNEAHDADRLELERLAKLGG